VMSSVDFWEGIYQKTGSSPNVSGGYLRALEAALSYFGDITGRTIVDLGCGAGGTSIFLARQGANVISIDNSAAAIAKLKENCKSAAIDNLQAHCLSANEIMRIPDFDFIFGSMILHHVEPFPEFAQALKARLKVKGFFWENNASSRLLVWFRNNIVGKFGIPKYGDNQEFPLTPAEVDELRKRFDVEIEYPEMCYWRLASGYLLKGKLADLTTLLDDFFYRHKVLLRYSYRQYVKISVMRSKDSHDCDSRRVGK
jgi:SAM-dependent methyltransferase